MSYKLVYVEWVDHVSHTTNEWRDITEAKTLSPKLVRSVGFILNETNELITLGQSLMEDEEFEDQYSGDICIHKKLIKKRKDL